jgi:hypothetical protein
VSSEMPVFEVTVTREDELWVVVIQGPFPPGSIPVTDIPRFEDVPSESRDLIADLTGMAEDEFEISWRYEIHGRDVTETLLQLEQADREHERWTAERDRARDAALTTLAKAGLSQRTISEMVGLSQQRVQQILRAAGPQHRAVS